MARITYKPLPCLCDVVALIVSSLGEFSHIDVKRVYCAVSRGSRTSALARIHGLGRVWSVAGLKPSYVVEVVWENFSTLNAERKLRVVIHELLHIPASFGGGLRPHGRLVNERRVRTLVGRLKRSAPRAYEEAIRILSACPPHGYI